MSRSCVGCAFLYLEDGGYSNWTVEVTVVNCALDRNPNLPKERPSGWRHSLDLRLSPNTSDNWFATNKSRCEVYAFYPDWPVHLDVDGNCTIEGQIGDSYPHFAMVLQRHSGRK